MESMVFVAAGLILAMSAAWAVQRATGNSGWIDAIWSFATAAAGAALALQAGGARGWLAAGMVALWGLRLGLYIAARSLGAPDDPRYAALRDQWGATFHARLFWFLMIQAVCAFVLALCVWAGARQGAAFPAASDGAAVAIILIGICGEGLADAQLRRFRRNPANRGQVCAEGLWGWSRHPNYFFEWLVWLAWPAMAFGTGWMALACAGPVLMYWLLVHASGIPPLEATMLRSRGDRYRDYINRVSPFFPWPPRRAR